jgi:hypothetical protein
MLNRNRINEQERNRRANDINFKLRKNISRAISFVIIKNNMSTFKYLTYTVQMLKKHLEFQFEPWMNWQNYGIYNKSIWIEEDKSTWTWNIDHIIPQSDLPYTSMFDDNFKKCWSLENLRPYSAKSNILDGSNRVRHKK